MKKKTTIAVGKLSKPDRSLDEPVQTSEPRPLPAGRHEWVPVRSIRPDPHQPRKSFPEESLDEMAASIHQQGIIQPLILELVGPAYTVREPDLHSKKWVVVNNANPADIVEFDSESGAQRFTGSEPMEPYYKILAGERRWRGATRTTYKDGEGKRVSWDGLSSVPAMVHEGLDDRQRKTIQIIENLQRENLSALEEATAYRAEIDKRRVTDPTFSAEKLAVELGMKRATMYGRLVLTRLYAPVREALVSGKISTSVAAVVAIVPLPKQQEKLLKEIEEDSEYGPPTSVRDVQEMVNDDYCKQLSEAPFDTASVRYNDSGEHKEMVNLSCVDCPHRSGNMADQFPDLAKRPNVCTRVECFQLKCKAHWQTTAEAAKEKGKEVLTEREFKARKGNYVEGSKHEWAENRQGTIEEMMGKHKPEPILVVSAEGLKKFYPKVDVLPAMKKNGVKLYKSGETTVETSEAKSKREAKEKEEEATNTRRSAFAKTLIPRLVDGINKLKDAAAWELLDDQIEKRSWPKERSKMLDAMNSPKGRTVVDVVFDGIEEGFAEYKPGKNTLDLWKALGVDLMADFEAEEKKAQKEMPLPAEKIKQAILVDVPAKPGGKFKMSAAGKARILAAQKARWAKVKAAKPGGGGKLKTKGKKK